MWAFFYNIYFLISIFLILLFCAIAYAQEAEPQSLDNKASFHYDLVEEGKQLSISLNNPEIPITKLQMITNDDVEDANFQFEVVSEPHVEKVDNVYKYISITAPKIADDNIKIAILRFKIPKIWFEENNYDTGKVILLRYDDGWEELKTVYEGSDAENHNYRAQIPGFSYFAIKAEKSESVVVEQIKTAEESDKETEQETEEEIESESLFTGWSISRNGEANPVVGITITFVIVILGTALFLFFKGK